MTVLGRFLEGRASPEDPRYPLTSTVLLEKLGIGRNVAGVTVNEKTALQLITVFRCVELIAGTCAALPLKAYRKPDRTEVPAPVLDDPHPELTAFETWEIAYACLLLWGNAYFRKLRDGTGRVRHLWPLHPSRVRVDMIDPTADNPGGKVFAVADRNGRYQPYTTFEVLQIPGLGYDGRQGLSRIQLAARGLAVGVAAEEYAAKFFANGSLFSGLIEVEKTLANEDQANALKRRWREKHSGLDNAHDVAVLDGGAKFHPISIPPKDAQLLEERGYTTIEIARLFGLPPHAVGEVTKSTSWGTGIEQQTIGMVQFTLQPSYLARVEQRLTKHVLTQNNVYAEYVIEGLLRGDSAARAAFYQAMVAIRAMNPNEVRARENLQPYKGGDEFVNPNITPAPDDTPEPDEEDEEEDDRSLVSLAGRRWRRVVEDEGIIA